MKKRILALMLACFMIVSLLPMQVFAEETVASKCPGEGNDHAKENCTYEVFKVVDPTCDDWGYTVYECDVCGDHFVDDITEKRGEHVWVMQEHVDETCTTDGIVGGEYCEVCLEGAHNDEGTGALDVIPAGHLMSEPVGDCIYAESECLREGCDYVEITTGKHCYVTADGSYNIIMTNIGAGLESESIEVTNNTCGIAYYECVVCGDIHEVEIVHELVFVEGKDGYCDHYACATCDRTFSVRSAETGYWLYGYIWIPGYLGEFDAMMEGAYDHLYELPEMEEVDPFEEHNWIYTGTTYTLNEFEHITCGPTVDHYECNICGQTEDREGKYDHTEPDMQYTIQPTCETYGADFYFCSGCGESWEENLVDPLGHVFTEWYLYSCNADGTFTWRRDCVRCLANCWCDDNGDCRHDYYYCDHCDYFETEVRSEGHDKVYYEILDGTCVALGHGYWKCSVCGETGIDTFDRDSNNHYGELLYVVEPTCTEDGFEFYFCYWCNQNYTVILPALNHELHTESWDSCGFQWEVTYCRFCDYEEENFEEVIREGADTFVYGENLTTAGVEAIHSTTHKYEVTYRNGYHEVRVNETWINCEASNHKNPTCGQFGYDQYYCWGCDADFMHILAPTGEHVRETYLKTVEFPARPGQEFVYAVEYKGGNIELVMEFEGLSGALDISDWKILNKNGEQISTTAIFSFVNGNWQIKFYFENIDYVEFRFFVEYDVTITPHLWTNDFPGVECHVDANGQLVDGVDPHWYCAECLQMVDGDEHEIVYDGGNWAPTCTENGHMEGWACYECDKYFRYDEETGMYYEVPTLIIPKLGHEIVVNYDVHMAEEWFNVYNDCRYVDYTQNPFLYNYCHLICENGCGLEFIDDYHEHTWTPNETDSYAPTCTETGSNWYDCDCGARWEEIIPATGHTYGEPTDSYCGKCEVCGFEHEHEAVIIADMPATCSTGAYYLYRCELCAHEWAFTYSEAVDPEVDGEEAYFNSHVWGATEELLDENGHGTGVMVKACTLCGYIHTWDAEHVVNYYLNTEDMVYVPGQIIEVTITLDGNYADVWGFDLDVFFDNTMVEYAGFSATTDAFDYLINAELNSYYDMFDEEFNYVSVAATAVSDALIVEDVVVTLYFVALDYGYTTFDLEVNDTLEMAGAEVTSYAYDMTMRISRVMDLDFDFDVDLEDLRLCYLLILDPEAEYNVLADADGDGDVDIDDLMAIYTYILNN